MAIESGEKVFTSWKDIASFFGKGVRTVQRWEQKFGLPISRPTAAKNVVLATERELREWIRSSSTRVLYDGADAGPIGLDGNLSEISARLRRLEEDTARLTQKLAEFSDRIEKIAPSVTPDPPKTERSVAKTESLGS